MKRVGIHTITDYLNYGNRLQNYAVQELLKSLGMEVESIVNFPVKPVESGWRMLLNRIVNVMSQSPVVWFRKLHQKLEERKSCKLLSECKSRKSKTFRAFSSKHIIETPFTLTLTQIPDNIDDRYDYCVVGSDQIWNPNIRYGSSLDFLSYVSKHKRIALSPSIGVSKIPEGLYDLYEKYLSEMAFLSVREEKGAELIKQISGREAVVLVDPTLAITTEHWRQIISKPELNPNNPYLLTYFIGEVSAERMNTLKVIASTLGLELVMMNSLTQPDRFHADPAEFLGYIESASLICTDSYHCIIFSMHFTRPFIVFDREGKSAPMGSRIDTLLNKFGFIDRRHSEVEKSGKYIQLDFRHVPELMREERDAVVAFLTNAFSKNCSTPDN
jgi:polysaccharide pyruvyl transferase WcaK-like protein